VWKQPGRAGEEKKGIVPSPAAALIIIIVSFSTEEE
jgi:hypothetical protein